MRRAAAAAVPAMFVAVVACGLGAAPSLSGDETPDASEAGISDAAAENVACDGDARAAATCSLDFVSSDFHQPSACGCDDLVGCTPHCGAGCCASGETCVALGSQSWCAPSGATICDAGPEAAAGCMRDESCVANGCCPEGRNCRTCGAADFGSLTAAAPPAPFTSPWRADARSSRTSEPTRGGSRAERLGWQSRRHCLNLARRFFAWAIDQGIVEHNPFVGLVVERTDGDEDSGYQESWYLDLAEQLRFANVWDSFNDTRRRERAIVEFALATGLREGEQWCLHLADVHVDGPSPHVVVRYGSWDREAERYRTPKGRKGSKRARIVPLFGLGLEAAKTWLAQPLYAPKNPHKLMFPTERGARREKPPRSWGDAVEAFGAVPRIRRAPWWHLLRHTFASSLVSGWWGMRWSVEDVSKVLGHTDIRTTQIYAHLAPKAVRDMAARAHAAYTLQGHVGVTPAKGGSRSSRDDWHARSDSNRRLPASKASADAGFAEGSEARVPDVAALVQVLQDIRDGRYKPDEPLVHGLTMALDRALAESSAAARKVRV